MAYIITEPCIGTKDTACADVCPVDCIHPAPGEAHFQQSTKLYIDPTECIDCDACVEACPVDATMSEDDAPAQWESFGRSTGCISRMVTRPARRWSLTTWRVRSPRRRPRAGGRS